ncbi:unnamed protein product [Brassicogethes aeneus]|uniref:SSD domain-containing protein n=1 Tax=Brassicogethes aeneus TaxID=1431903 RepID=A0A9P0BAT0_BRAAE|nr:unnamed protein product [Brassicogethes aeneus]
MTDSEKLNIFQKFTYTVVKYTELFFYKLGLKVGTNPKRTILLCWIFVIISSLGFLRFRQEKNPLKLWVPPYTTFIRDSEWLMSTVERGFRVQSLIITGDDVLTPEVFKNLLEVHEQVRSSITADHVTWNDVCFKIPKVDKQLIKLFENVNKTQSTKEKEFDPSVELNPGLYCSFIEVMKDECFERSILELWDFDRSKIESLTKSDILNVINNYNVDSIMGRMKNYRELLGNIQYENGTIVKAGAITNTWWVNINFSTVDMDKVGNMAGTADWASEESLSWELKFLEIMENASKFIKNNYYYEAGRSFGDISNSTMFQDIHKLILGVFIMVVYVQLVISKFNYVEARVILGFLGLLTIGMSFIVGCGLCSLFGVFYGPVHTSLPFLLMGLGVDDMFVILACWNEMDEKTRHLTIPERIGIMLKHAGVSITVTSITDVVAFIIGSSTILPCLQSFCIYAGFSVLMIYVFSMTFFTACLVLDQERIDAGKNIICVQQKKFVPNQCSQINYTNKVFKAVYSKVIFTLPGKLVVILITIICLGFSIESSFKLEKHFDPNWFVPEETHLAKYIEVKRQFYPSYGFNAGLYLGSINYTHEINNIKRMVDDLEAMTNITTNVISWVDPFRDFVFDNYHHDIYNESLDEDRFNIFLSKFLFSPRTALYQANFQFERKLECGVPAPTIQMSSIEFNFKHFTHPREFIPVMHQVRNIPNTSNFTTGDKFSTVWSKIFATWITDEVIDIEVIRNLQLALACVMGCTILLIADWQVCFWIFVCVLITMVNVCGFMQRWGLTIDLVSCIGLELAIGLCVDYAAHIGHTFLTVRSGSRTERALETVSTIGSAVLYGGLSTLIGVFMLSQSDAYTFRAFFKIFFLVILFGLFHGVVLLPVILSWIGSKPYRRHNLIPQMETEMT